MAKRILYRSLIGHEDFALGPGKLPQERGEHSIVLQKIELPFIFRTVDEIKELDYTKYMHIGLHIEYGAVIEYYYDPTSTAVADDNLIIKPNSIHVTLPGRYIKVAVGVGGSGGIVYTYTAIDYTIQYPNECVLVDSNTGPITITLSASPVTDNYSGVWDCGDRAALNNITIVRNGQTIHSLEENALIDTDSGRFDFIYTGLTWEFAPIAGCSGSGSSLGGDHDTIIAAASTEYGDLVVSGVLPATTFRAPYALDLTNGYIRASLTTAPTGADVIIDVHMNGVSMFSTLIHIDINSDTSVGSITPAILTTTYVPDDAEFEVFITQVGSTITGSGLKIAITGIKV